MKKILFSFLFIFFIFTAFANATCPAGSGPKVTYHMQKNAPNPASLTVSYFNYPYSPYYGWVYLVKNVYECAVTIPQPEGSFMDKDGVLHDPTNLNGIVPYTTDDGIFNLNVNPDPLPNPSGRCRDLFQKDGTAYTCNPNTNEATPIPNSDGTVLDENGDDKPNCNQGFESYSAPHMSNDGSGTGYTDWGCAVTTGTSGDTGNTNGGTGSGTGEPSISYGGDGSVTMTLPDGTKQTTYGDGWVTTTYPDGSTSSTPPRTGGSGGSSGGSGTSGGGTGGTSGNTTNENNTTPPTDTPIDNTPVANSCSDSALTLQERMLCELNAGMKKQNSEGNPQNSLNQLLKDLKTSNQTDNTAINTNLKDIKSGTTQLVNKQTQANTTLDKINNSANATELYTKSMNDGINKISKQLEADPTTPDTGNALNGSGSIIDTLANEYTTFKNNMINQGNTIGSLIDSSKQTINQGFSFSLAQSDVTSCPMNSQLDLTSINQGILNITLDICEYSSMLKPYLYPLFLIFMTLGLVFASFRLIGVLL